MDEYHDKFVQNSLGARAYNKIPRALAYLMPMVKDKDDKPVDFAHSYDEQELDVPVYADDEGEPARDVTLIQDGILTDFMPNRETSVRFCDQATGNLVMKGCLRHR